MSFIALCVVALLPAAPQPGTVATVVKSEGLTLRPVAIFSSRGQGRPAKLTAASITIKNGAQLPRTIQLVTLEVMTRGAKARWRRRQTLEVRSTATREPHKLPHREKKVISLRSGQELEWRFSFAETYVKRHVSDAALKATLMIKGRFVEVWIPVWGPAKRP